MTILTCLVLMAAGAGGAANPQSKIGIEVSAQTVGKYQKAELLIRVDKQYGNPFDPDEIDLAVVIATPGGKEMVLPAFFCQPHDYRVRARYEPMPIAALQRSSIHTIGAAD